MSFHRLSPPCRRLRRRLTLRDRGAHPGSSLAEEALSPAGPAAIEPRPGRIAGGRAAKNGRGVTVSRSPAGWIFRRILMTLLVLSKDLIVTFIPTYKHKHIVIVLTQSYLHLIPPFYGCG